MAPEAGSTLWLALEVCNALLGEAPEHIDVYLRCHAMEEEDVTLIHDVHF